MVTARQRSEIEDMMREINKARKEGDMERAKRKTKELTDYLDRNGIADVYGP